MTFAYWCVLAGALMPILWTGIAKASGPRKLGRRANHNPREWLEGLDGMQKRAHWAQQNAFEAFPAFAAGVIIASIAGASMATVNILAGLWIVFRLLYGFCYLADKAEARSVVWFAALFCVVGLFIAAA